MSSVLSITSPGHEHVILTELCVGQHQPTVWACYCHVFSTVALRKSVDSRGWSCQEHGGKKPCVPGVEVASVNNSLCALLCLQSVGGGAGDTCCNISCPGPSYSPGLLPLLQSHHPTRVNTIQIEPILPSGLNNPPGSIPPNGINNTNRKKQISLKYLPTNSEYHLLETIPLLSVTMYKPSGSIPSVKVNTTS